MNSFRIFFSRKLIPSNSTLEEEIKEENIDQVGDTDVYTGPDRLSVLPNDILKYAIGPLLDTKDTAALVSTSHLFHETFQTKLRTIKLLQHIVRGELAEVRAMLANDPKGRLLLNAYEVIDYSGRKIKQTAYLAALAAMDEEMAAVIQEHLLNCHGRDVVESQQNALFSIDEEKDWEMRKQQDREALDAVFQSVANSQNDEDCAPAIQAFREHMDSCKEEAITTGYHFNPDMLMDAHTLYNQNYAQFGNWNSRKNNKAWREIVGYIQRHVPANIAMAFCQDFHHIVRENKPLKRSLNFEYDGSAYFPLDLNLDFRLGFDFGAWRTERAGNGIGIVQRTSYLSNFLSDKNSRIAMLRGCVPRY